MLVCKQTIALYLKSIDIKDGDGQCVIPRINLLIYSVYQPAEQEGIQDLGNCISVMIERANAL